MQKFRDDKYINMNSKKKKIIINTYDSYNVNVKNSLHWSLEIGQNSPNVFHLMRHYPFSIIKLQATFNEGVGVI